MTDLPKLIPAKEAADILAISVTTLRELVRHGEIAYIQRGRGKQRQHLAFHPQDIEDYIKRCRTRVCLFPPRRAKSDGKSDVVAGQSFLMQRAARLEAKRNRKRSPYSA